MSVSLPEQRSAGRLATEAVARAVSRLACGRSWEGISYEIAFRAVVAAGADLGWVGVFAPVAAAELAELVDALPGAAAAAAARARAEHERQWPYDRPGAELAAELAAVEEAEQLLAEAYATIIEGLTPAVRERAAGSASTRLLSFQPRAQEEQAAAMPLTPLAGRAEHFGWPLASAE